MKVIKFTLCLVFFFFFRYALSQEINNYHFSLAGDNSYFTNHKYELFNNPYYHSYGDKCDIFVDGFDKQNIRTIILIKHSLSFRIEELLNNYQCKRACISLSFELNDKGYVSIKLTNVILWNNQNNHLKTNNLESKIKSLIKLSKCDILYKNSKQKYYSCVLLFNPK